MIPERIETHIHCLQSTYDVPITTANIVRPPNGWWWIQTLWPRHTKIVMLRLSCPSSIFDHGWHKDWWTGCQYTMVNLYVITCHWCQVDGTRPENLMALTHVNTVPTPFTLSPGGAGVKLQQHIYTYQYNLHTYVWKRVGSIIRPGKHTLFCLRNLSCQIIGIENGSFFIYLLVNEISTHPTLRGKYRQHTTNNKYWWSKTLYEQVLRL